ncbi:MAG: hypothetical protein NUV45_08695 [Tepidanaerobacteraceae bacterium]|jgi:hypothetical protein|nr:hypothetical protein [Tepidanaerobacteraceae bacterium]
MKSTISNSIAKIVMGVTANKKSILAIPSEEKDKDTVEFVIDEKNTRILVHSQGILIKAKSTSNNLGMGLKRLVSNPDLCRITIPHADVERAVDIILGLDC